VGRQCKERTPGERSGLKAGQEKGYGQICMEIPRVNLDTGRLKRTTKQASKLKHQAIKECGEYI
jgi:hypothetical protein